MNLSLFKRRHQNTQYNNKHPSIKIMQSANSKQHCSLVVQQDILSTGLTSDDWTKARPTDSTIVESLLTNPESRVISPTTAWGMMPWVGWALKANHSLVTCNTVLVLPQARYRLECPLITHKKKRGPFAIAGSLVVAVASELPICYLMCCSLLHPFSIRGGALSSIINYATLYSSYICYSE